MKNDYAKVIEWAVWANLDRKKDLELVLLTGHLILEVFMDNLFENGTNENYRKFSFYRKVNKLHNVIGSETVDIESIKSHLLSINKIRNKFVHERDFEIHKSEIECWSLDVLSAYDGEKFSKFTYRTKVVHAFSVLAGALAEIQQ